MMEEPLAQTEQARSARSGRWLIISLVAALATAIAYLGIHEARHSTAMSRGALAPSFKLARYGGGTVSLEDLRGKVVMLDFWATWCLPCVAEMPALTKLAGEYEPKGLVFVAANRDDGETAPAQVGIFVAQRAPDLGKSVVFADDQMAMSYGLEALPTLYFIGRDGRIVDSYSGYASESALRRKIEKALEK
jgi:thiol-disulfide isomerase/thioredoxin